MSFVPLCTPPTTSGSRAPNPRVRVSTTARPQGRGMCGGEQFEVHTFTTRIHALVAAERAGISIAQDGADTPPATPSKPPTAPGRIALQSIASRVRGTDAARSSSSWLNGASPPLGASSGVEHGSQPRVSQKSSTRSFKSVAESVFCGELQLRLKPSRLTPHLVSLTSENDVAYNEPCERRSGEGWRNDLGPRHLPRS
jgi:hypothetical protein